jgi:L-alanine-DL-glutamate epimerase-like enolase superfamily enzyme
MKITRLCAVVVDVPIEPPIVSAVFAIHSTSCILCYLETDQGLVGEGLVHAINGLRLKVLHEMVRSLEPLVMGLDATLSGSVNARAWKELNFLGYEGVTIQALAGIDMLLWDLRGKAAELNVSRLIGAVGQERRYMPAGAYGSLPRSTNCSGKPRTSSPQASGP